MKNKFSIKVMWFIVISILSLLNSISLQSISPVNDTLLNNKNNLLNNSWTNPISNASVNLSNSASTNQLSRPVQNEGNAQPDGLVKKSIISSINTIASVNEKLASSENAKAVSDTTNNQTSIRTSESSIKSQKVPSIAHENGRPSIALKEDVLNKSTESDTSPPNGQTDVHKPSSISANSNSSNLSIKPLSNHRVDDDRFQNLNYKKPTDQPTESHLADNRQFNRSISESLSGLTGRFTNGAHRSSANDSDFKLNSRLASKLNLTSTKLTNNLTTNEDVASTNSRLSDSSLPAAESSTIEEVKLDNRSTANDEDAEFDEFEVESKKEDESSIVEHDKASNKVENNQLDKVIRNKLKDNVQPTESTTPKTVHSSKDESADEDEDEFASIFGSKIVNSSTSSNESNVAVETSSSDHLANDAEHEDDDGDEEEDEPTAKTTGQSNERKKGERERESLLKLQAFLQNTVEQALKGALPELVKTSYETNLSSTCTNSFLAVTRALQGTKQWAYKSECFTFWTFSCCWNSVKMIHDCFFLQIASLYTSYDSIVI